MGKDIFDSSVARSGISVRRPEFVSRARQMRSPTGDSTAIQCTFRRSRADHANVSLRLATGRSVQSWVPPSRRSDVYPGSLATDSIRLNRYALVACHFVQPMDSACFGKSIESADSKSLWKNFYQPTSQSSAQQTCRPTPTSTKQHFSPRPTPLAASDVPRGIDLFLDLDILSSSASWL